MQIYAFIHHLRMRPGRVVSYLIDTAIVLLIGWLFGLSQWYLMGLALAGAFCAFEYGRFSAVGMPIDSSIKTFPEFLKSELRISFLAFAVFTFGILFMGVLFPSIAWVADILFVVAALCLNYYMGRFVGITRKWRIF